MEEIEALALEKLTLATEKNQKNQLFSEILERQSSDADTRMPGISVKYSSTSLELSHATLI